MDSILVGQIISSINLRLNIRLKNQDLFNYSTIRKLTGYIVEKHGDTIVQALSDNLFKEPENAYGIVPDEGDAQQGGRFCKAGEYCGRYSGHWYVVQISRSTKH